jgi:hypothetical protein
MNSALKSAHQSALGVVGRNRVVLVVAGCRLSPAAMMDQAVGHHAVDGADGRQVPRARPPSQLLADRQPSFQSCPRTGLCRVGPRTDSILNTRSLDNAACDNVAEPQREGPARLASLTPLVSPGSPDVLRDRSVEVLFRRSLLRHRRGDRQIVGLACGHIVQTIVTAVVIA